MEIKKYAAIDIGSNAIRLLVANVIEKKDKSAQYSKSSLVRVPIRLGADAFTSGVISDQNIERTIDAMNAFRLLMKVHGVQKFKACATSALRESTNQNQVIDAVFKNTGIKIDLIDGKTEAAIISTTDLNDLILGDKSYLYVDVGGGSTELTFFSKGRIVSSKSFKIGTVRFGDKKTNKVLFNKIENWIKEITQGHKVALIGSGGNINKIFKMSGRPLGKPLSYIYLLAHYEFLKKMSYVERITELGLNPDRADVIIPATKIYLSAMKWCKATKIYVPKIGLADGIIKGLHQNKIK